MTICAILIGAWVGQQTSVSPLDQLDPGRIPEALRQLEHPPETVAILRGHTRGVASLVFSPDMRTLVSAGWDNKLRWWHVVEKELKEGETKSGSSSGLGFSPDGKMLISGGDDAHVHFWVNGKEKKPLAGHKNRPFAVAFSPNSKLLATGCGDPVLRVWKMDQGEPEAWAVLANQVSPSVGVSSLSFSFDSKYLAIGHHAGKSTLRIWDVGGSTMAELDTPDAQARFVAFSPSENLLAFSGDASIRLWQLKDGKATEKTRLPGHPQKEGGGGVKALAFAPDGRTLASAGQDRRIVLWDLAGKKKHRQWTLADESRALAFAADGRHLAIGSEDGTIYVLRLSAVKMKR